MLILQTVQVWKRVPDSLYQRRIQSWVCVGGWAHLKKLPIIQLSTQFPLVHWHWINWQKAGESDKEKSENSMDRERVKKKKTFLCSAQLLQWTKCKQSFTERGLRSWQTLWGLPCSVLQLHCLAGDQLSCSERGLSSDPLTNSQDVFQCVNAHVLEYA